jgi:pimeloyl-ACP methyl ester carboxylesterase
MWVPFGGRGLQCLSTSPFGERHPAEVERDIAGDGKIFYVEYFSNGAAEREIERDVRDWMEAILYSFSASPPLPPEPSKIDFARLPDADLVRALRETPLCLAPGAEMRDAMVLPSGNGRSAWYTQADIDLLVGEFERTGFVGPLNFYRCVPLNWEILSAFRGRPIEVTAMFLGGDRDVATRWARTAIADFPKHAPQARPTVVLQDCGHCIQQEKPDETNVVVLEFLRSL